MKRGSREIGKSEGISSRQVRHRYRIFQNFRPVALAAKPVDERKELGGGPEQVLKAVGLRRLLQIMLLRLLGT
jgi:hypothetical protein